MCYVCLCILPDTLAKVKVSPISSIPQFDPDSLPPSDPSEPKDYIAKMASEREYAFPDFDELPKIEGQPQGCLWGFFDRDGKKDEVGSMSAFFFTMISISRMMPGDGRDTTRIVSCAVVDLFPSHVEHSPSRKETENPHLKCPQC